MNQQPALTLRQLNAEIARQLSTPMLTDRWVTAELSDMRLSGGHCYMELLEKDERSGAVLARLRAIIWAGNFGRISANFLAATGQRLATGLKVMVCGTINYHVAFGLSLVISAIDPSYTMGEVERRRREILMRLQQEGVLELNRSLEWPEVVQNVAVISAQGAAGYGDFLNQLYHNAQRLRFRTRLFPAVMQGERTASSIIAALDAIAAEGDEWDCVVIIRGGGATSDLVAYDDYNLASNIAQFPIPVIIGIGHERDVTVLDYVANMRVKTPTAAAEWLIAHASEALERLRQIGERLRTVVMEITGESRRQLAYYEGILPVAPLAALDRAKGVLNRSAATLSGAAGRRIASELTRLGQYPAMLAMASATRTERERQRLKSMNELLKVLSPMATLRRGYTITRIDGHAVTSATGVSPGSRMVTIFADGKVESEVR